MKAKTKFALGAAILALSVPALLLVFGGGREPAAENTPGPAGPLKVEAAPVRAGTVRENAWITGEVRAPQSVDVVPKISGRLERMRLPDGALIEEGAEVAAGQVVAELEHEQYRAAVSSAEAALQVARTGRDLAEVNLAEARREKDRWTELRKGGTGTEQQLDRALTAFERAGAEAHAAEARIVQAQAALEQARVNLAESVISAPISGVVSRKHVDEGAFVGPGAPLFRIADIREVEITGGIADRNYPLLAVGETRAEIEVDAFPGETFAGRITRIRPELDRVTRTVEVTILVPNEGLRLKPGMYARIRLVLRERAGVPLVPDEALVSADGAPAVFVVENGTARLRKVELGLEEGNLNEVLSGLRLGELTVIRGRRSLHDGSAVTVAEEPGR